MLGVITKKISISDVEEIPGHGLKGKVNNNEVLAGNGKLLQQIQCDF